MCLVSCGFNFGTGRLIRRCVGVGLLWILVWVLLVLGFGVVTGLGTCGAHFGLLGHS